MAHKMTTMQARSLPKGKGVQLMMQELAKIYSTAQARVCTTQTTYLALCSKMCPGDNMQTGRLCAREELTRPDVVLPTRTSMHQSVCIHAHVITLMVHALC